LLTHRLKVTAKTARTPIHALVTPADRDGDRYSAAALVAITSVGRHVDSCAFDALVEVADSVQALDRIGDVGCQWWNHIVSNGICRPPTSPLGRDSDGKECDPRIFGQVAETVDERTEPDRR